MTLGQEDAASGDALRPEPACQPLRCLLAAAVGIGIEGEINGSRAVAQLPKLAGVEMRSQRAGDVAKTRLPQHGVVEQPLDENDLRVLANLLVKRQFVCKWPTIERGDELQRYSIVWAT